MTEELTAAELGSLVGETVERLVEWRALGLLGRERVQAYKPEDVQRARPRPALAALRHRSSRVGEGGRFPEGQSRAGERQHRPEPITKFTDGQDILGFNVTYVFNCARTPSVTSTTVSTSSRLAARSCPVSPPRRW